MISLPKKKQQEHHIQLSFFEPKKICCSGGSCIFHVSHVSAKDGPCSYGTPYSTHSIVEQPKISLFIMGFMKIQIAKIPTLSLSELPLLSQANIFQRDPVVWFHYKISPTSNSWKSWAILRSGKKIIQNIITPLFSGKK